MTKHFEDNSPDMTFLAHGEKPKPMTKYAVKAKLKKLHNLLSEWSMLDSLIDAMEKTSKKGLKNDKVYMQNVIKRRDKIQEFFTTHFNNITK
jgi:hypothetical protein